MLALGLLAGVGCHSGEPSGAARQEPAAAGAALPFSVVRYQDIVVDQARYGTFDPATGVHTCADESHDSFVLAAGERRTYKVTLPGPSELLFGGCAERKEGLVAGAG